MIDRKLAQKYLRQTVGMILIMTVLLELLYSPIPANEYTYPCEESSLNEDQQYHYYNLVKDTLCTRRRMRLEVFKNQRKKGFIAS